MQSSVLRAGARVAVVMVMGLAGPAAGALMALDQAPAAEQRASAGTGGTGGIVFADDAVVVPPAVVKAELAGVRGSTYTFRHATGQIAKLTPGKVMVLEGSAAGMVTRVARQGAGLVVATKQATLGQVMKSGSLAFDVTPDFGKAFTAPIDLPGQGAAADVRFGSSLAAGPAARSLTGSLSMQGGYGPFGYSLTGTSAGPGALDIDGHICANYSGSECANGPSSNPAWEIGVAGTLDLAKIKGAIQVSSGAVQAVSAAFSQVKSQVSMNYTFSRGDGSGTVKFPPVKIPFGWDIPIPNPYVPLFVRVQFSALVQVLTKPAKNTVSHGALMTTYAGTAATGASGNGPVTSAGPGDTVKGAVSPGKAGLGISLSTLGLTVTFQEKAGIAVGFGGANVMAFTDFTSTIGQEQSSAIAGSFCSSYLGVSDWGVGLGAELGGPRFGLATQIRKSLVQKQYRFSEPGCAPITG